MTVHWQRITSSPMMHHCEPLHSRPNAMSMYALYRHPPQPGPLITLL